MTKVVKAFALSIVLIALVLAPACRSKKAPQPPKVAPTDTTASIPPVPVTATETRVANPPDFVQPATPTVTQYNLALGDRRANAAKEYMVTLGVDAGRVRTVSYGEERPFDPGHDEAAWAKNRRAHLVIVGK